MKREEAIKIIDCYDIGFYDLSGEKIPADKLADAFDMAIEALSKPNHESDTEVRLAVTNRNKDKVVLWDAFGEVEYYPHGEINEPTQTHGRLIDADALSKKLCETTLFVKDGEVFQRMINDAPTVQADRPHGEWDRHELFENPWYTCSVCNYHGRNDFNFCPNCGAKMKGGDDE